MGTFEREGVTIGYDDIGRGDPPIVLIHGLGGSRATFSAQVERFGDRHRLLLPDLRGHGESSHSPESIDVCADDVAALCADRGLERPVVVGFSLGGSVAVSMAARHGDRVSGVVLIDPPLLFRPDKIPGIEQMIAGVHSPDAVETWVGFAGDTFDPLDDPRLKEQTVEAVRRTPGRSIAAGFDANAAFDGPGAFRACKVPLLFIAGFMPTEVYTLNELCPHAWWGRVVGTGHFAHLTAPDQVNAMLARFLDSLARKAA